MSRKKKPTPPGPPVFMARKEGAESVEAMLRRKPRDLLAANFRQMHAAATRALSEPDTYNTHESASVVIDKLQALEPTLTRPDDVVQLVQDALLAGQEFTKMRVNATLSEPVNQVRNRNRQTAEKRRSPAPRWPEPEMRKLYARGLTELEEMNQLGIKSRSTNHKNRIKYGPQSKR
jgi:hypothetical protein